MHTPFLGQGSRAHDRMVVGFPTTCAIMPINTSFVSSNLSHAKCTGYNIIW